MEDRQSMAQARANQKRETLLRGFLTKLRVNIRIVRPQLGELLAAFKSS